MADAELVKLYQNDELTIRDISTRTGASVYVVRKALIEAGVAFRGSRGIKPSRETILASYGETRSCEATAEALGVSPDLVADHARSAGILRGHGGVRRYSFDAAFFDSYTPASCYWGGFIAADGCLVDNRKGARILRIMLKRSDRPHLESFAQCAKSEHPVKDVVAAGALEVEFSLSSCEWWDALHARFNITERKSLTLSPPPAALQEDEALCWHYVRGYFDGDGCDRGTAPRDLAGRVKQIDFSSGSRAFIEWLRRFLGSHHKLGLYAARCWRLSISGDVMRLALRKMYADSTPATRLARKYRVLKHHLD